MSCICLLSVRNFDASGFEAVTPWLIPYPMLDLTRPFTFKNPNVFIGTYARQIG